MSRHQITAEQRRRAKEVAKELFGAFIWKNTPQGHGYWSAVFHELSELAEGQARRGTKGQYTECERQDAELALIALARIEFAHGREDLQKLREYLRTVVTSRDEEGA